MRIFRLTLGFLFAVFLTALILNLSHSYSFNNDSYTYQNISINTSARKSDCVYVGGMPIGMTLYSKGVIVIGITDITTENGNLAPSRTAGLENGDVLTEIAGEKIEGVVSLDRIINNQNNSGKTLKLKYIRKNKEKATEITPALDAASGRYKLGLWIRDSAAGIGTLTFMKETKQGYSFGALGHPICDPDTLTVVPVRSGDIYRCNVIGVKRSQKGVPGELKGVFLKEGKKLGEIKKNNKFGVFGSMQNKMINPLYPKPIEICQRKAVKPGKAKIVTTIGDEIKQYDIEIIKTNYQRSSEEKSMVIRVVDDELLKKTGGIVQGMSGSPIIQNGKLVGAVTHVFINDPTKGFGVYLDWMINE